MDVNEAIVKSLENIGVDHVFGGSGQVNGSMLLALKKIPHCGTSRHRNSLMCCRGILMKNDAIRGIGGALPGLQETGRSE